MPAQPGEDRLDAAIDLARRDQRVGPIELRADEIGVGEDLGLDEAAQHRQRVGRVRRQRQRRAIEFRGSGIIQRRFGDVAEIAIGLHAITIQRVIARRQIDQPGARGGDRGVFLAEIEQHLALAHQHDGIVALAGRDAGFQRLPGGERGRLVRPVAEGRRPFEILLDGRRRLLRRHRRRTGEQEHCAR
ncbi:hypothetical protein EAH87_17105 [Sphingomonas koreensis]|nr:hypothetical protein EAH87_17105 [Sphingomonas koreensis]